jgi:hypothetical protein
MSAKYRTVTAEVVEVRSEGLKVVVAGNFWFALAQGVTAKDACDQITDRGKQLAFLVKTDQDIESVEFRNGQNWIAYPRSDEVARACAAGIGDGFGLGEPPGDRWIGFELSRGTEIIAETRGSDVMGYPFRFTLNNFRTRFQAVPVLHACRDLPIARLHVVSVVILRADKSRIGCSVDSTIEQRS